jgi:hypothetical protein
MKALTSQNKKNAMNGITTNDLTKELLLSFSQIFSQNCVNKVAFVTGPTNDHQIYRYYSRTRNNLSLSKF